MSIHLLKKQTFNVPEGHYRSKVVAMYSVQGKGKCDSAVKILFAPLGLETKLEQSVVASEYCVDASCEQLVDDLDTILSGETEAHIDEKGDFNEKSVNDRLVDIVVKGYHKGNHERPYTFVTAVFPPDTLNLN
jgi:hypothetical protein